MPGSFEYSGEVFQRKTAAGFAVCAAQRADVFYRVLRDDSGHEQVAENRFDAADLPVDGLRQKFLFH